VTVSGLSRAAGIAALVICAAFLVHNVNGLYVEPRYLGFASYTDYADLDKLIHASRATPWLLSGLGHVCSGFAMVVLAVWAEATERAARPVAARIAFAAGLLAAAGFLLLGLSHVIGRQAMALFAAANPEMTGSIYLTATIVRVIVNGLAQVALGGFTAQLSWCARRSGALPRALVYFGFLSAATGLLMVFAYIPLYLFTVLIWSGWLGIVLVRSPVRAAA
jgi:hypothetical protein